MYEEMSEAQIQIAEEMVAEKSWEFTDGMLLHGYEGLLRIIFSKRKMVMVDVTAWGFLEEDIADMGLDINEAGSVTLKTKGLIPDIKDELTVSAVEHLLEKNEVYLYRQDVSSWVVSRGGFPLGCSRKFYGEDAKARACLVGLKILSGTIEPPSPWGLKNV